MLVASGYRGQAGQAAQRSGSGLPAWRHDGFRDADGKSGRTRGTPGIFCSRRCFVPADSRSNSSSRSWLFVRVGVQVTYNAEQGLRVLEGPVGITDFTVGLVAHHVRAISAVG